MSSDDLRRPPAPASSPRTPSAREDVLELLLPDAAPPLADRARRVTTFLRLLCDDARSRSENPGPGLERALGAMRRLGRDELRGVLEDLLRYHLAATLGPDRFPWFGAPTRSLQEAWSLVERARASDDRLPRVPDPGEDPPAVARRLLDAASRTCGDDPEQQRWQLIWEARLHQVAAGPQKGEERWRAIAGAASDQDLGHAVELAAVAGVAECLLDRAAVARAVDWLDEHLALVGCDDRTSWLFAWSLLLLGRVADAEEIVRAMPPSEAPLPPALAELRAACPAWTRLLPGRVVESANAAPAAAEGRDAAALRSALGACAFGVFALRPGAGVACVELASSPGLRARADGWLAGRDGACRQPGEPEHRLVARDRALVLRRDERTAPPLRGALSTSALALVLVPIRDGEGEVAGWLHVECEHHLLPSSARAERLAAAWRTRVLAVEARAATTDGSSRATQASGAGASGDVLVRERPLDARGLSPAGSSDPRARLAHDWIERLATKTARRRWWLHDVERGRPVEVAGGGGGLTRAVSAQLGGGRALRRALALAGPVSFDEPDERLSLHPDACSGLVVPIVLRGDVLALVTLESERRRDFREADVERLAAALAHQALPWRCAQFRAWHADSFGAEVHLDAQALSTGGILADLPVAGRSRAPAALAGPEGSGKEVLARWLHFEGERPDEPLVAYACAADEVHGPLVDAGGRAGDDWAAAGAGTLLLDELDALPLATQLRLRDLLARRGPRPDEGAQPPRPRLIATTRQPLRDLVAGGRLRGDLAGVFARLEVLVPPLRRRRDELVPLVRCLATRCAEEEGRDPVRFDEHALALLWRQRWPGNVRELEGFVYKLVLFAEGELVTADDVRAVAGRYGVELLKRLPSRHPDSHDVEAALRVTRKATGSFNKTRAALYLGWDPDTLAARMRDARIEEPRLFD